MICLTCRCQGARIPRHRLLHGRQREQEVVARGQKCVAEAINSRYINEELEEGKPCSRFSDYRPFSGSACIGVHFGDSQPPFRRLSSSQLGARHRQIYPDFVVVRKSAIGLHVISTICSVCPHCRGKGFVDIRLGYSTYQWEKSSQPAGGTYQKL